MSRFLQNANLIGIVALLILCAFQWHSDHVVHLQKLDLDQARLKLQAQLAERDQTLQGTMADLNDFHNRLAVSDAALKEVQDKLKAATDQRDQAAAQRDQLKASTAALQSSLDKWTAAVATRDEALKQADAQVLKIANERNDTVTKFNDLATKYNAAAEALKKAGELIPKLAADRNEAVTKFNDLASKYNALMKETNGTTTKP